MEYSVLVTVMVFILGAAYFIFHWCNSFSERFIEKLKEIQPPVKAEEKGNSFSYPEGKTPVITTKGHPLGEGVRGHIEGYVTDGGIAYALMMFGNDFYRLPVKELYKELPDPETEPPNGWWVFPDVTTTAANPTYWLSKESI